LRGEPLLEGGIGGAYGCRKSQEKQHDRHRPQARAIR
jgi:hypothetical protein